VDHDAGRALLIPGSVRRKFSGPAYAAIDSLSLKKLQKAEKLIQTRHEICPNRLKPSQYAL
jgi:hypothetical protein